MSGLGDSLASFALSAVSHGFNRARQFLLGAVGFLRGCGRRDGRRGLGDVGGGRREGGVGEER